MTFTMVSCRFRRITNSNSPPRPTYAKLLKLSGTKANPWPIHARRRHWMKFNSITLGLKITLLGMTIPSWLCLDTSWTIETSICLTHHAESIMDSIQIFMPHLQDCQTSLFQLVNVDIIPQSPKWRRVSQYRFRFIAPKGTDNDLLRLINESLEASGRPTVVSTGTAAFPVHSETKTT